MPGSSKVFAQRTVTGTVAGMVVLVFAGTGLGFWLSYGSLHTFAVHAGLRGPEAWAWPACIDLFTAVGEAGVTIAYLRRHVDPAAWAYLILGFGASVTANWLHVEPAWHWLRYAAAPVPPVAAMLALAALLRQVYLLAVARHVALQKAEARERRPVPSPAGQRTRTRQKSGTHGKTVSVSDVEAESEFLDELAAGTVPSIREIRRRLHAGQPRAQEIQIRLRRLAGGMPQPPLQMTQRQ